MKNQLPEGRHRPLLSQFCLLLPACPVANEEERLTGWMLRERSGGGPVWHARTVYSEDKKCVMM